MLGPRVIYGAAPLILSPYFSVSKKTFLVYFLKISDILVAICGRQAAGGTTPIT